MSDIHIPVMLQEVIESFRGLSSSSDLVYYDGTFGRGGHAQALMKTYKVSQIYATDQDQSSVEYARLNFPEIRIINSNFLDFAINNSLDKAKEKSIRFNMILLDLGVSSPQLDNGDRGFSFNKDGPLDMRMNRENELTAERIINEFSEDDLILIFKKYGEIERPHRVVKAIVNDRVGKRFISTLDLAGLIERVDGWKKKGFHPATQYFMALRLVVNNELGAVEKAIPLLIDQMVDGGLFSIITFHSLEDRIVKNLFKENSTGFILHKKVIVPTEEECKINPRARSAKLRIFQKGVEPEKPDKFAARRALREIF